MSSMPLYSQDMMANYMTVLVHMTAWAGTSLLAPYLPSASPDG